MRYAASEKLEIIRLVEGSHLSARMTLAKLGIPRTTFYRWYDRYLQRGETGLQDQSPKPKHVWNRIPNEVRRKVVRLALKETDLSPRELSVTFTDTERYFVSEASVYRVLKAHDLITSPAFIVIKAASEFKDKTTAINQPPLSSPQAATAGQRADRLHLPQGSRLGLVLSQHRLGRLQPLHHRLEALHQHAGGGRHRHPELGVTGIRMRSGSRRSQAAPAQRQRLQLRLWRFGRMVAGQRHEALTRCAISSPDTGQDREVASDPEEPHPIGKLLSAWRSRSPDRSLCRSLQSPTLPREPEQRHTCRRLLRQRQSHSETKPLSGHCYAIPCRAVERIKQKTLEARRLHHRKHAA